MKKKWLFLDLFLTMFRIGICTFGGGYAMLPLISDEFVTKRGWITDEQMVDIIAIAESLPGAVSIEVCIIVGYRVDKLKGAIASCLGVVSPSLIIITIVTYFYNNLKEGSKIWLFVRGIRGGVIGLMSSVIIKLFKTGVSDKFTFIMFLLTFMISAFTNIHVIMLIIGCGIVGYFYGKISKKDDELVNKDDTI